jgi:hypothetical protein
MDNPNIVEASLTIDGIYYVVDLGFLKQNVYNPKLGVDSLVIISTSHQHVKEHIDLVELNLASVIDYVRKEHVKVGHTNELET